MQVSCHSERSEESAFASVSVQRTMLKISRHILAPSGAAESSPAGTAGSATLRRTVPAGTADERQFQPSLSGLGDMPQLTRQFLPGYFHSRLSALSHLPLYPLSVFRSPAGVPGPPGFGGLGWSPDHGDHGDHPILQRSRQ
jgi:hypothetical protein